MYMILIHRDIGPAFDSVLVQYTDTHCFDILVQHMHVYHFQV